MEQEFMLTTVDNPYNPFTEFDDWLSYDELMGYHTCEYLAKITLTSDALSDVDQGLAIDAAIDEIVQYNINGLYRKVTRS